MLVNFHDSLRFTARRFNPVSPSGDYGAGTKIVIFHSFLRSIFRRAGD